MQWWLKSNVVSEQVYVMLRREENVGQVGEI